VMMSVRIPTASFAASVPTRTLAATLWYTL
jgi:hypothetical protein